MDLGAFSISLSVNDLEASWKFYEAFGFEVIDGQPDERWLVLQNGEAKIGLFEKMFDGNLITFHPSDAGAVESALDGAGIAVERRTAGDVGATQFTVRDPDGNVVLVDQHTDD